MDALGEVRRKRGVTYYHQLYTLLVAALGDGLFTPGSALPTESELMERFRVSRNTVRRALARLEEEKRIVRRRGSGSYARSAPPAGFSPDTIAGILQDFDATSSQTSTRLLRIESGATPEHIRRRDPNFGELSVMVQRMRSFKQEPLPVEHELRAGAAGGTPDPPAPHPQDRAGRPGRAGYYGRISRTNDHRGRGPIRSPPGI